MYPAFSPFPTKIFTLSETLCLFQPVLNMSSEDVTDLKESAPPGWLSGERVRLMTRWL